MHRDRYHGTLGMEEAMKCNRIVVVAVVAALALGACSSDKKGASSPNSQNASGTVTVYTTEGLKNIVDRLVKAYTTIHSSAKVVVDTKSTAAALKASVAKGTPQILLFVNPGFKKIRPDLKPIALGQTRAVIAVSTKNPKKVADVTAFAANSGLHTAMCGARTGFGNTALWVMFKAKVKANTSTIGVGCEAKSMQQLSTDQLDAVLLFRGGSHPPKGVKLLDVPEKQNIIFKFSYQSIGTSAAVKNFATFLAGKGAQQILTTDGYLP